MHDRELSASVVLGVYKKTCRARAKTSRHPGIFICDGPLFL